MRWKRLAIWGAIILAFHASMQCLEAAQYFARPKLPGEILPPAEVWVAGGLMVLWLGFLGAASFGLGAMLCGANPDMELTGK